MKTNKDKIIVGHSGIGSATHLCMLILADALGTKFVPHKGASQNLVELMANQLDFTCEGLRGYDNALSNMRARTIQINDSAIAVV
jgi:tripartite-type tricarboxylate transporter receptor subunit TctC